MKLFASMFCFICFLVSTPSHARVGTHFFELMAEELNVNLRGITHTESEEFLEAVAHTGNGGLELANQGSKEIELFRIYSQAKLAPGLSRSLGAGGRTSLGRSQFSVAIITVTAEVESETLKTLKISRDVPLAGVYTKLYGNQLTSKLVAMGLVKQVDYDGFVQFFKRLLPGKHLSPDLVIHVAQDIADKDPFFRIKFMDQAEHIVSPDAVESLSLRIDGEDEVSMSKLVGRILEEII